MKKARKTFCLCIMVMAMAWIGPAQNSRNDSDDDLNRTGAYDEYNINWGGPLEGVANAVDIDAHPFFNILCAIDGMGSRIAYYTPETGRFQTLCEIPDYIDRANRIAVCPLSEPWQPVKWTVFVSTIDGQVYELISFQPGGFSIWKKHSVLARDIAIGRYKGTAYAISIDGAALLQYDDYNDKWKIVYYFKDLYPGFDIGIPIRIDIPDRQVYIMTSKGLILGDNTTPYWWSGGSIGAYVSDFGIANSDSQNTAMMPLFAVGSNYKPRPNGNSIQQNIVGKKWHTFSSGLLTQITVSPEGEPWGINGSGQVFHGRLMGTPPSTKTWIQIKLTKIKYKDNHIWLIKLWAHVDCFVNDLKCLEIADILIQDGDTINYNYYLRNQAQVDCWPEIIYKIAPYTKHSNGNGYYRPLVYGFTPKFYCDQGRHEVYGEDNEIVIRTEWEVRNYPFVDPNYTTRTPPKLPKPSRGKTLPHVVYRIDLPSPY